MTQLIDQPCWWRRTADSDWERGTFRGWGTTYWELCAGVGQYTVAIVQCEVGEPALVPLYYVRFCGEKPPTPSGITRAEPQPEPVSDDAAMAQFGRKALDALKTSITEVDNCIDVDELAESAEQFGLMRRVEFDPDKHDKLFLSHDYLRGDMVYVWGTDDATRV